MSEACLCRAATPLSSAISYKTKQIRGVAPHIKGNYPARVGNLSLDDMRLGPILEIPRPLLILGYRDSVRKTVDTLVLIEFLPNRSMYISYWLAATRRSGRSPYRRLPYRECPHGHPCAQCCYVNLASGRRALRRRAKDRLYAGCWGLAESALRTARQCSGVCWQPGGRLKF